MGFGELADGYAVRQLPKIFLILSF
jgi:hypothetical protein